MKIMHSKKHHQEYHLLKHSLKLTHKKSKAQLYKTFFYFKDFKMVNASYEIRDDSIKIDVK